MQEKRKKRAERAVFLLMTAQTFLHKAWIAAIKDKLSEAEVFTVVLEPQGKNFEMALKRALQDGFRDILIFRVGEIPGALTRKIPEILEMNRRVCLDADFSYGVGGLDSNLKNSKFKQSVFYRGNKHDDQ